MKKISLYDLAVNSRRLIVLFLLFALVVVAADTIFKALQKANVIFTPTVTLWEELPSNVFGKITFPQIPGLTIKPDSTPVFGIRGDFPLFPDTAQVYQINRPREKLDSTDRAKAAAQKMGFSVNNFTNVSNLLTWQSTRQTRKFEFHLTNNTWDLQTVSYFQDANALAPKTTNKETNYGSSAISILGQLGITSSTFSGAKTDFELVKRRAERFAPISFTETPDYAVVSIFRQLQMSQVKTGAEVKDAEGKRIENYKAYVYSPDPTRGSINMVLADRGQNAATELYEFKFTEFDYTTNASYYYVITPAQAWQNVQSGKGILVQLLPQSKSRYEDYEPVSVRRFTAIAENSELAYLETPAWTGYVYPIYIFRGTAELTNGETANFVFYTDAIRP